MTRLTTLKSKALPNSRRHVLISDNGREYTAADYDFALSSLGTSTPFSAKQKPFVNHVFGTCMHNMPMRRVKQ